MVSPFPQSVTNLTFNKGRRNHCHYRVMDCNATFGGVDEVGRDVAAVELHPFDDLQLIVQRLAILIEQLRYSHSVQVALRIDKAESK